jgi:hypothetical protein
VELASLRSEIRKATTAADQARRTAESAERLRAVDGISQEDYKKAIEETERARFALADAKDRLRIAQGLPAGTQPILDPENDAEVNRSSPTFQGGTRSRGRPPRAGRLREQVRRTGILTRSGVRRDRHNYGVTVPA